MKMLLVSVRDLKTSFFTPTLEQNENSAIRNFKNMLRNAKSDSLLAFSPADFDLYVIGTLDIESGTIVPETVPRLIFNGGSYNEL